MAADEEAASERFVADPHNSTTATIHRDNQPSPNTDDFHHQNESREESKVSGTPPSSSSSDKNSTLTNGVKGRTCKGCLYYSSAFKSNSRNPVCVGFTRSYPNVPRNVVSKSEMEASQAGSRLVDFKYSCLGYSAYSVDKVQPNDEKETTTLPICVGIEILMDRRVRNVSSPPAHIHNKEVAF
ncbi:OLC1v1010979C1 [Oldenlandia corymbosa var. corymbosa]|uniref:OLC1v1010979C1 n=1 Tax=Oldenlandia corymbosa var. corymbosa TaxID=529605 RepID=A0AAV1DUZ4_OLDCO|nr:OLC1v1010979C1 [Oldenlandia corymbosa var. corymbosa]